MDSISVPRYVGYGKAIQVKWEDSQAEQYSLLRSVDGGMFETVYTGAETEYTDIADVDGNEYRYKLLVVGDSEVYESVAVAIVYFTLDYNQDGRLQPFNIIVDFNASKIDTIPSVVETAQTIAGKDGAMLLDMKYDVRLFNIIGRTVANLSRTERDEAEKEIATLLNKIKGKERFLLYRNKLFKVCIGGKPDVVKYPSYLSTQIALKAYNPYGYSAESNTLIGAGEILNNGNEDITPTIVFQGPCINPSFKIGNTTYGFITGCIVEDGTKVVIDCEKETVKLVTDGGGIENLMGAWSGSFPIFKKGKTTISDAEGLVRFEWREKDIAI